MTMYGSASDITIEKLDVAVKLVDKVRQSMLQSVQRSGISHLWDEYLIGSKWILSILLFNEECFVPALGRGNTVYFENFKPTTVEALTFYISSLPMEFLEYALEEYEDE